MPTIILAPISTTEGILILPSIPPLKQVPHFGSPCLRFKDPFNSTIGFSTTISISVIVKSCFPDDSGGTLISGSGKEIPTGCS